MNVPSSKKAKTRASSSSSSEKRDARRGNVPTAFYFFAGALALSLIALLGALIFM